MRYLREDVDRHGNVRVYLRQPGHKMVRMRSLPGTAAFLAEYEAAVGGADATPAAPMLGRGSFGYVANRYMASDSFAALEKSTQNWRRNELTAVINQHGDKPLKALRPIDIRALRDQKPTANGKNNRLAALRALFVWAVEHADANGAPYAESNPCIEVKRAKVRIVGGQRGHHSWTFDEIAQFEARHPVGSKPRLAMALMLYTACRREDAVRLGPQHIKKTAKGLRLVYTQAKNEHRKPVQVSIPLHPELKAIIDATPSGHLTFLITDRSLNCGRAGGGHPYTVESFGGWFHDRCAEAGLRRCTPHGLRKACAAWLASKGASPHMIAAITGHVTLQEVTRYTEAANREKLADAAMELLSARGDDVEEVG